MAVTKATSHSSRLPRSWGLGLMQRSCPWMAGRTWGVQRAWGLLLGSAHSDGLFLFGFNMMGKQAPALWLVTFQWGLKRRACEPRSCEDACLHGSVQRPSRHKTVGRAGALCTPRAVSVAFRLLMRSRLCISRSERGTEPRSKPQTLKKLVFLLCASLWKCRDK